MRGNYTKAVWKCAIILFAVISVSLTACGGGDPDVAATIKRAQELQPADPQLAAIYARSCRSCHTVVATGAPLTGDTATWAPRMAEGMDLMLEHVIEGFGGMPPLGLCMDCSPEQFEALIRFMASSGE